MLEGAFTSKLLKKLRTHPVLKDAIIYKHSDYFTKGIPDFSITFPPASLTTWWEVKMFHNQPTGLQQWYHDHLRPVSYFIIAQPDGKMARIIPSEYGIMNIESLVEEIVIQSTIRGAR